MTNHVLGETWTFLRRRLGHPAALGFVDRALRSSRLTIHHFDEATEQDAWAWLRRHDEREYSFVDAPSFAGSTTVNRDQAATARATGLLRLGGRPRRFGGTHAGSGT